MNTPAFQKERQQKKRGLFVVFEGTDGSGSSTQAQMLHDALRKEGVRVWQTYEPTNGPIGNVIRLAMSHRLKISDDKRVEDRELAYLFAADRYDHLFSTDGIVPKLREGWNVISTRYYLSSLAYHATNDADLEFLENLNREFPPPDLTFFLQCPVNVCLKRIQKTRLVLEKYENETKLNLVRNNYEKILKDYPHPLRVIDASQESAAQHRQIWEQVKQAL